MIRVAAIVAFLFSGFIAVGHTTAAEPIAAAMKAASEQSHVQVEFANGDRVGGKVHARTSSIRLWLEVKSSATVVVLPLKWSSVVSVKAIETKSRTAAPKNGKSLSQRAHALLFDPVK